MSANHNLLQDFMAEAGITTHPLGTTMGGGFLTWAFTATETPGTHEPVTFGIIVTNEPSATGDLPSVTAEPHADWLWWQRAWVTPDNPTLRYDGSDAPLLRFRAQRRMDEMGLNLFAVYQASVAGQLSLATSTVLILP